MPGLYWGKDGRRILNAWTNAWITKKVVVNAIGERLRSLSLPDLWQQIDHTKNR